MIDFFRNFVFCCYSSLRLRYASRLDHQQNTGFEISLKKSQGLTLLETLLVLVLGTSLLLMGLRAYQIWNLDKEAFVLKTNVDSLFYAMKGYYQTECNIYFSNDGSIRRKGTLTFNPTDEPIPPDLAPVPFDVSTISSYVTNVWPKQTSLVATGGSTAYVAQFNPLLGENRQAFACSYFGTGSPICSTLQTIPNSKIVFWQSQIAVLMRDPTKSTYYQGLVSADCAVNTLPTEGVNCATDAVAQGNSANYLVWQRMPSFSSPASRSSHWVMNPIAKQFKLQYTHDPMYEMYNTSATPTDIYQYYLCGD